MTLRKATLLITSGPPTDPDRKHLFVCLTNAFTDDKLVLTVPVCSIKEFAGFIYDDSCELSDKDHSWLRRPSYINYRKARLEPEHVILNGVDDKVIEFMGELDDKVFVRICEGLYFSRFTSDRVKNFYTNYCLQSF